MTGQEHGDKTGRRRHYDFTADPRYPSDFVGYSVSVLDELLERTVDQISDLPAEALAFQSQGVWFCLGWLPLHLAASEYYQINRLHKALTGGEVEPEPELTDRLAIGKLQSSGTVPEELHDAELLIDTMRRVRDQVTKPICESISDPDATLPGKRRLTTPRNVLMHLFWHWTYHSGHIGLMRLEWGSDYEWTMAEAPAT